MKTVKNDKNDSYKDSNSLLTVQQEPYETIDAYLDNQQCIQSDLFKYTSDTISQNNATTVHDLSPNNNCIESSKDKRNIENKFEVCKDIYNCDSEIVDIGLKCGKINSEKKEQKQLVENKDKVKEHEFNIKKQIDEAKHYLNSSCFFKCNCWKNNFSSINYRKTIGCRYYDERRCNKGIHCKYKHPNNVICRYYIKGICRNGDMCNFIHINKDQIPPLKIYKKEYKAFASEMELDQTIALKIVQLVESIKSMQTQMDIVIKILFTVDKYYPKLINIIKKLIGK